MLSLTAQSAPACALCGGPLPAGSRGDELYCCEGCARVAEILESSDYDGDPRQSRAWIAAAREGLVPTEAPREASSPDAPGADQRELRVEVDGMWCPSCAWLVETVVARTPGVHGAQVTFVTDQLRVRYDPARVGPAALHERVEAAGYGVREAGASAGRARAALIRFGVAAFFTANVMGVSYALYAHGRAAVPETAAQALPFVLAILAAPVVFGAGAPVLKRAARAALQRAVTMDTLIALGAVAAYLYSVGAAFAGSEHVYFDGASAVITFWLLGRLLEKAAFRRADLASDAVRDLLPRKARRLESGETRWVDTGELAAGDLIRVAPGERVPVDGHVFAGEGRISTAVVDGEPRPRTVRTGEPVPGGSTCGELPLDLEVVAGAEESLLSRIADHVALAAASRAPQAQVIDAVARIFVPLVTVLAVVTAAAWMTQGLPPAEAFIRGLTVLVVSCPCALGVAGPLARVLAAGALARRGIAVRGDGALDRAAVADTVAFDKTGTLTRGELRLVAAEYHGCTEHEALRILAGLEQDVHHAVAGAIRRVAEAVEPAILRDVEVVDGQGVRGMLDHRPALAGRPSWIAEAAGPVPPLLDSIVARQRDRGHTVILATWGERAWAALSFADRLRDEAAAVAAHLRGQELQTVILSGDSAEATARVGAEVGIRQALGDLTPEDKAAWIRRRSETDGEGTLFVGDGINDAPALAAGVGVAVAGGTDFARETADILLAAPGLDALPQIVGTARQMRKIIIQNLAWAGVYNAVALPAAVFGLLNPVLAAAMMVGSGLLVTLNALRLRGGGVSLRARCKPPAEPSSSTVRWSCTR